MAKADHKLVILLPRLLKWLGFSGVATMPSLVIYEIKVLDVQTFQQYEGT